MGHLPLAPAMLNYQWRISVLPWTQDPPWTKRQVGGGKPKAKWQSWAEQNQEGKTTQQWPHLLVNCWCTYHLHGKTGNCSWTIKWFAPYTLFQNGGDPGWSGSSCTKTRHRGPRNTRSYTIDEATTGNGQTYCQFRKKSTKTANITRCLHDFEKPRLFWLMNTSTRSRLTKIKVINLFLLSREVLPQGQKANYM